MPDAAHSIWSGDPRVTEVVPGRHYALTDPDNPDGPPWAFRTGSGDWWCAYEPDGTLYTDASDATLDDAIGNVAGPPLWRAEATWIIEAAEGDGTLAAADIPDTPTTRYALAGLSDTGVFAEQRDGSYTLTSAGMDLYDQIAEIADTHDDDQAARHAALQALLDDRRAELAEQYA